MTEDLMLSTLPDFGAKVNFPDGEWQRLGAFGSAAIEYGLYRDGRYFEVKDGRVIVLAGGLRYQDADPNADPESFITVNPPRRSRKKNLLELETCEPEPSGTIDDGLYVSSPIKLAIVVFQNEIVMRGPYEIIDLMTYEQVSPG